MTTEARRPGASTQPVPTTKSTVLQQFGRDSAYLLSGLPLAIVSFTLLVVGLALGLGLLITVVGVPVLVIALMCARKLAAIERWRVEQVSGVRLAAVYRSDVSTTHSLRGWWERLRDTQAWLDAAHGVLALPLAIVTWSIAVIWWSGALSGLTYWMWSRALPQDGSSRSLSDVLDLPWADWMGMLLMGVFFALTLIPVLRFSAGAQTSFASVLLGNSRVGQLQERIAVLTASRSAAAQAEVDSLRRLERDLHDGPQQRLVRLGMDLAAIKRRLARNDGVAAAELVDGAGVQVTEALTELRALTRGIAPPILVDRGLAAALTALADRAGVSTTAQVSLPERYAAPVETAAYFVVSEALTNVAKHSGAKAVTIRAEVEDARMVVEVMDDGVGGASFDKGRGLAGLADRVAALDGQLSIHSPDGGPTAVRAVIPCG